jgi:esterase/lipase superfamily enzyme
MPDTTGYGNYVDWYNAGAYGPPKWETFHMGELLPWIDAHYPTIAARSGRAIAGLSMGGGGAMHDAARHPDLFTAAAAFSGAVDTNSLYVQPLTSTSGFADGEMPNAVFGPRATDEVRWRGHNPWDLAMNLRGMFLQLDTGNGQPGGPGGGGDPVESGVHEEMVSFHQQLDRLGYPHVWNDYGAGGHAWWYWTRDLRQLLPRLAWVFATPPAPPARVTYTSIEPAYSVYGWHVAIDRPAVEFSELVDADASGFTVRGSGTATVTTPPAYAPGSAHAVRVNGVPSTAVADAAGRLTFTGLQLGTANPYQQYSPEAKAWMLQRATFSTAHYLDDIQTWPVHDVRVEISVH